MAAAASTARTVLVTGGSKGIGLACIEILLAEGYRKFAFCARDGKQLTVAEQTLKKKHPDAELLAMSCDVADTKQVERFFQSSIDKFSRIDIVINNAGVMPARANRSRLHETSLDQLKSVVDVNVYGAFNVMKEALREMRREGSGVLINMSSKAGTMAFPNNSAYCISKFALEGMSRAGAVEVDEDGLAGRIVVTSISPGSVLTELNPHGARKPHDIHQLLLHCITSPDVHGKYIHVDDFEREQT